MAYEVTCSHCSARFSLTADLYARRIKGRISTIRCPRCSKDTTIDDSEGEGRSPQLKPLTDADSSRRPEPISERRISHSDASAQQLTPVSDPAASAPKRLQPPPVPRKTPEVSKKALWIVSYEEDDDRELTVLQIRSALVRGEVSRDTLVWQEGMAGWVPMAQVPELASILPRPGDVLRHRLPADKSLRRPSSRPPPKPDAPLRMPAIPGARGAKPPLPPSKPDAAQPSDALEQEKPRTRPDLPKPRRLDKSAEPAAASPAKNDDEDRAPPSSGSPALRSLTHQASRTTTRQSPEDLLLGMQSADPGLLSLSGVDASQLTAPVFDDTPTPVHAATPAAPAGRRRMPSAAAAPGVPVDSIEDLVDALPRASAPPRIEAAEPEVPPERTRSSLPWVVLLAALVFGVVWLLVRAPWAARARSETTHTPPAVVAAKPAAQVAHEEPVPPLSESAAAVAQADAAGTAVEVGSPTVTETEQPRQRARVPTPVAQERAQAARPTVAAKTGSGAEPPAPPTAAEPPVAEAPRPVITSPFDKVAAVSALNNLAAQAAACRQGTDPSGMATVVLTFAPSGRVTNATVNGPPFAGTPTGGCVARTLRRAQVPPFAGDHVTVSKSVLVQ